MKQTLIKNISSLVTIDANNRASLRGQEMQNIGEISDGAILFDEKIRWIGTSKEADRLIASEFINPDIILDFSGKTILPGFVDSHTHFIFAGDRSDEFARRLRGATYKDIAESGGGILKTMRSTREASIEELINNSRNLILSAIHHGTTAFEIKSGYGFTLESELKMLYAIRELQNELPVKIRATFLGAHDIPPEYQNNREKYIDILCNEMIPQVASENLADFCDAFVDDGYYTISEAERIFKAALDHGLKLKVHADELACVDAAQLAARMGAISADHLLCISDKGIEALKNSSTVATLLPGTAYFIRMPYAPARKLIDAGCTVALATDCNPGSCFTENMQMILSLSVINMKITAEESIVAATLNGAAALGLSSEFGSLEIGKRADFVVYNSKSYIDLFYHFGINHVKETWINGKKFFN